MWAVPFGNGAPKPSFELVRSDIGDIKSIGLTKDGVLYYKYAPASANISVAQLDVASKRVLSTTQPIQRFSGQNTQPDWSGDGAQLAYVSRRYHSTRPVIAIMSNESGTIRELYPPVSYLAFPRWSPDSKQLIARGADLKGRSGIVRIDAATGDASLVVPNEVCSGVPYWAADSRSFFCYHSAAKQIAQVDVTSGAVLKKYSGVSQGSGASPDGRYVSAFNLDTEGEPRAIKLVSLATGESRVLLPMPVADSQFGNLTSYGWTPDSRYLFFFGKVHGQTGLWLVPVDGGEPQRIAIEGESVQTLRMNPKTGQIAWTSDVAPRVEVWKMEHFLTTRTAQR